MSLWAQSVLYQGLTTPYSNGNFLSSTDDMKLTMKPLKKNMFSNPYNSWILRKDTGDFSTTSLNRVIENTRPSADSYYTMVPYTNTTDHTKFSVKDGWIYTNNCTGIGLYQDYLIPTYGSTGNVLPDLTGRPLNKGNQDCNNPPDPSYENSLDNKSRWITSDAVAQCCSNQNYKDAVECNPSYRFGDANSSCNQFMYAYCTDPDYVRGWNDNTCQNFLQTNTNTDINKRIVQDLVVSIINSRAVNNQLDQTGCIGNDYCPNRDKNDPLFSTNLHYLCGCNSSDSICNGACDDVLNQYCARYKKSQLYADSTLRSICGCHLSTGSPPKDSGLVLADKSYVENQYTLPDRIRACDPACSYGSVIQQSEVPACGQTVCVVDKLNVNSVNSSGNINISQNCSQNNSSCYLGNITVNDINSNTNLNFIQNCQYCYSYSDEDPEPKLVDCKTLEHIKTDWKKISGIGIIVLLVVLLILLIIASTIVYKL